MPVCVSESVLARVCLFPHKCVGLYVGESGSSYGTRNNNLCKGEGPAVSCDWSHSWKSVKEVQLRETMANTHKINFQFIHFCFFIVCFITSSHLPVILPSLPGHDIVIIENLLTKWLNRVFDFFICCHYP